MIPLRQAASEDFQEPTSWARLPVRIESRRTHPTGRISMSVTLAAAERGRGKDSENRGVCNGCDSSPGKIFYRSEAGSLYFVEQAFSRQLIICIQHRSIRPGKYPPQGG